MNAPFEKIFASASLGDVEQLRSALKGHCEQRVVRKALKAAARNGHNECVQLLMDVSDQGGVDRALCEAAKFGEEEAVKILLKTAKPLYDNSRALKNAAAGGHTSCLTHLIDQCYSQHPKSIAGALVGAAENNHEACVDILLQYTPSDVGLAASVAASSGCTSILQKLLAHCSPSEHLSRGLVGAVSHHHDECAKLLIGVCDARYLSSRALVVAFEHNNWELFDLLVPHSDIGQAQTWIGKDNQNWDKALARRQQTVLQNCVETGHKNARGRKI